MKKIVPSLFLALALALGLMAAPALAAGQPEPAAEPEAAPSSLTSAVEHTVPDNLQLATSNPYNGELEFRDVYGSSQRAFTFPAGTAVAVKEAASGSVIMRVSNAETGEVLSRADRFALGPGVVYHVVATSTIHFIETHSYMAVAESAQPGPQPEPGPEPEPAAGFADVKEGDWFKPQVDQVAAAGLMSGLGENANGEKEFGPDRELTVGQAMVLAFQIHSRANGGTLPQAEGAWYMPYYQYCLDNGIITGEQAPEEMLGRTASRFEVVSILDGAVPESRMAPVRTLADGDVPDVAEDGPYGEVVYRWYRAGLVSGGNGGCFYGDAGIERAQAAVILCQINNLV